MTDDPVVVIAATPRGWAGRLRAHAADHGGVVVRATVLTPDDALAEQCDVVVVDDVTSFLTAAFVQHLQAGGRAVLGVYDAGDAHGKGDLVDAGVDALVEADAEAGELVARIRGLASTSRRDRPAPAPANPSVATTGRGRIIGVAGPGGGAGVTEVALEVAARLASADVPTVLVDADELSPSVAQRLGLDVHPNLHTALRAVQRSRAPDDCLHRVATRRPLRVLPGMATPDDWHVVRSGDAADLLAALSGRGRHVVVDLGHCLPPAEGPAGMRFGHARLLAGRCTDLLVVAAPTPTALARTIDLVATTAAVRRPTHLVLNRAGDRFVRQEAVAELRAATGVADVHVLAEDARVPRAAWQGRRAARGRFRRDVGRLVTSLGWLS